MTFKNYLLTTASRQVIANVTAQAVRRLYTQQQSEKHA